MSPTSTTRILHVVYNLIRGGTEGQCARTVLALPELGVESKVAVFRREGFFLDRVETCCGPVYEIGIRKLAAVKTVLEMARLAAFIRRNNFHIMHCWDADAAIFGSVAARMAGIPYITSRRDLGQIYPSWKLKAMGWADRGARRVVVNADAIRRMLVANGLFPNKIEVQPNILDVKEFDNLASQPFSKEALLPPDPFIVSVSRLDPEKNVGAIIRAISGISNRFSEAHLVIAGDGAERKELEQLALMLGLSERVLFLGDVEDIPALLRKAAIGVLVPSSNEGLSNAIMEYMTAGLPVIASDCGGNGELVVDGITGLIVKEGGRCLSDALCFLLERPDEARKMGMVGRRDIESIHQPTKIVKSYTILYQETAQSGLSWG